VDGRALRLRACQTAQVRWERLFDDLEAQLAAADAGDRAAEIGERTRIERGRIRLSDRLRGGLGSDVTLHVTGSEPVRGRLLRVAADCVVVDAPPSQLLVAAGAVSSIEGLGTTASVTAEGPVDAALGLRSLLRGIGRDRATVRIRLRDRTEVTGRVDAVGADWFDVALHPAGEAPRRPAATVARTLPLEAVAVVRLD
jgi:hypothetical protein